MFKRRFKRKDPLLDKLIAYILIVGGALLVLIYIPIWAWMALFGVFLVGLGILILLGWR